MSNSNPISLELGVTLEIKDGSFDSWAILA